MIPFDVLTHVEGIAGGTFQHSFLLCSVPHEDDWPTCSKVFGCGLYSAGTYVIVFASMYIVDRRILTLFELNHCAFSDSVSFF